MKRARENASANPWAPPTRASEDLAAAELVIDDVDDQRHHERLFIARDDEAADHDEIEVGRPRRGRPRDRHRRHGFACRGDVQLGHLGHLVSPGPSRLRGAERPVACPASNEMQGQGEDLRGRDRSLRASRRA